MSRHSAITTRALWTTVGVAIGITTAYLHAAVTDTRDAERTQQIAAAYRQGWRAGATESMCLGVLIDGRTGMHIQDRAR